MSKPPVPPAECCDACRFYRPAPALPRGAVADVRGACRRFPAFLDKLPGEWCGEFKTKGSK